MKELVGKLEKLLEKVGTLRLVLLLIVSMCALPPIVAYSLAAARNSNAMDNMQLITNSAVWIAVIESKIFFAGPLDFVFAGALILFLRKFKTAFAIAVAGFVWVYTFLFLGGLIIEFSQHKEINEFFRVVAMSTYTGWTLSLAILSYMLPTIVAFNRKKKNRWRYFFINLFLTPIPAVWPVTLFNAFRDDKDPNAKPPAGTAEKSAAWKKRRRKK